MPALLKHLLMVPIAFGALSSSALAQEQSPLLADSFRLGEASGALCQVQTRSRDAAFAGIFDRAWSIVCRDSARPVGKLYALRGGAAEIQSRLSKLRQAQAACTQDGSASLPGLGKVETRQCRLNDVDIGYAVFSFRKGNTVWVAEGISAYESALKLGLRTIVADQLIAEPIEVATTSVNDAVAFARIQAGTLDPDQALAEGYRRNNSGNYAEAAEFFGALQSRLGEGNRERLGEYLINRALQKSNLGEFAEADALFAQTDDLPLNDRVQTRLKRNFVTIHLLNQQRYEDALTRLDQPVTAIRNTSRQANSAIEIGTEVAAEINTGLPVDQRLSATESNALSSEERARFLDAQALQLRGTLLRLTGKADLSAPLFDRATRDILAIRNGRVVSVTRLRSQILAEEGLALEALGNVADAEAKLRESVVLLETRYPQSSAVNGARARFASFLARHRKADAAITEYRQMMNNLSQTQSYAAGFGNLLAPYLDLLTNGSKANDPASGADLFLASQLLVRPGIADTQAVLARELSEGSTESARLFRQSRNLEREIERSRIETASLLLLPEQSPEVLAAVDNLRKNVEILEKGQLETQSRLAAFPQFRAISARTISLDELKASLKSDEAYLKLVIAGRSVFGLLVDRDGVKGFKTGVTPDALDQAVDGLRETIASQQGGQVMTYAFDVALARKLFVDLLAPVADRVTRARHIIFEPDGAMLRLPLNLLVTDQQSVDAYQTKIQADGADEFDFRGVQWLGRGRTVTTTVSAKAFRDARTLPPARATRQYFGFGENAPITTSARRANYNVGQGPNSIDCSWPTSEWNKPISAAELNEAETVIGKQGSTLLTGAAFTDTAILKRTDLGDYRIIHFATHGLVTAPRPECPARPALLTSFGDAGSDGLLSFKEIFDLKLNADIVILSACDTAGRASVSATREAGVTSGGGNALDGLVRAFIGAGGRTILASHWPAPDEYGATKRLISGLFTAQSGASIGEALQATQLTLMDSAETSHPYYWAGFATIGDSSQPVLPKIQ